MDCVGLDLHKRESQLCILTETDEVIEQDTVPVKSSACMGPGAGALDPVIEVRSDEREGKKRGGARVHYLWLPHRERIYLLFAYSKSSQVSSPN